MSNMTEDMTMTAPKGYSTAQIALHWVIAILIIGQLIFGEEIGDAYDALRKTGVATYDMMTIGHIGAGVLILLLALWRLVLRLRRGVPEPIHAGPKVLETGAQLAHWAFYLLIIAVPVTGLVAWFGGQETAAELHELSKPVFVILILAHVIAAAWHQYWLKDGLIRRMMRADG
jgi:cytochrome b561